MSSRYVVVSGSVFGLIALAQLLRAINQVPIQAGSVGIPVWISWAAAVLFAGLSVWAFASRK